MIPEKYRFDESHPIIATTLWKILHALSSDQEKRDVLKGLRAAYTAGWTDRGTIFQDAWMKTIEEKDWASILGGE